MRTILLFLATLVSLPTFAVDRFAQIDALFEGSTAVEPRWEDVTGWWSGRCFYHNDHETPIASVMAAGEVQSGGGSGPLFPSTSSRKMAFGVRRDKAPEYFDVVSSTGERQIREFFTEAAPHVTSVESRDRSLAFEYLAEGGPSVRYRVRVASAGGANYYLAKGTLMKEWRGLKEGDTQSLCYYFAKVRVDPSMAEPPSRPSGGTLVPETADCVCNSAGIWEAQCPQAIGHWVGGRTEPGINVRRCGELNGGATSGVCSPGTTKNIYTSPAPALTNLCR